MKKNTIYIVILAVLVCITAWLIYNNTSSTIKRELKDFAVKDTTSITKLFLADKKGNTVLLEKEQPGLWRLNKKYVARPDAINLLLYTISKLDVKGPVAKSAIPNILKSMGSIGVKCEIYQNDKLTKAYYVGGETIDQLGTNMLLIDIENEENSASPFVIYIPGFDGYLTPRYISNETEWRDRKIFNYTPPEMRSVKLEFNDFPEKSHQINLLSTTNFEVINLKTNTQLSTIDTLAVKQYLSYFRNVHHEGFEDELPKTTVDSILATPPNHILTITDAIGKQTIIKTYKRQAKPGSVDAEGNPTKYDMERMFAQINGVDFVSIQFYAFGILFQPIEYFMPKTTPVSAVNKK